MSDQAPIKPGTAIAGPESVVNYEHRPRRKLIKNPRIRPQWFDDIEPSVTDYLIKGVWEAGGLSLVFGPTGSGKSFLVADMALAVARNIIWADHKVRGGAVLYVAAEGQGGFRRRISAYRQEHMLEEVSRTPFGLVTVPLRLLQGEDVNELLAAVQAGSPAGAPIRLLVIDTLARTMAGGDENDPKDMGRYIESLGKLQAETGAHVVVVHHTGKKIENGVRGHSSLLAAMDTAIEVRGDSGVRQATIIKQKDGMEGPLVGFDLKRIELGLDTDGEAVTSCVVRLLDRQQMTTGKYRGSSQTRGAHWVALDLLRGAIEFEGLIPPPVPKIPDGTRAVTIETWQGYCVKGGISASSDANSFKRIFRRCMQRLRDDELIGFWDGWVWPT